MNPSNEFLQAERLLVPGGAIATGRCKMIVIETALVGSLTVGGFTASNQASGAPLLQSVIPPTSQGIFYPPGGGQGWPITFAFSNPADMGKATVVYGAM